MSGRMHTGGMPLFARAGAVIPVVEGSETTLMVFGASADTGFGRLYVDDGETAHWWRDGYSMEFKLRREGAGFVLERELSASAPGIDPDNRRPCRGPARVFGWRRPGLTVSS